MEVDVDDLLKTFEALELPAIAFAPGGPDVVAVNAAAAPWFGTARGPSWLDRVHPDDRERVVRALGAKERSVSFRATRDELAFTTWQLELRPRAELTLALMTERTPSDSSSEPELAALLQALPFEVWERDANGVLVRQNEMALRNWGTKLGTTIESMGLAPEMLAKWKAMNAGALAGKVVSIPQDYDVGGRRVSYTNLIAPVRDGDRIRGVVGVNIDVTARRAAEAELALAQSQLVRRERLAALGELAAVVAHEVRNPLAAIYNSLSTLKRQLVLDESSAVLFAILEEEATRLNRTVADLLNYVRPLEPERRPDDLAELAREVVNKGSRRAAKRGRSSRRSCRRPSWNRSTPIPS